MYKISATWATQEVRTGRWSFPWYRHAGEDREGVPTSRQRYFGTTSKIKAHFVYNVGNFLVTASTKEITEEARASTSEL